MTDLIDSTKRLAESHGLEFHDCGEGHVQIRGHGNLVNYWPTSKRKTLYSPTLNRRERDCTPWDAVKLCMSQAKQGMRPKAKIGKGPAPDVKMAEPPKNPAGLVHFYEGGPDDPPPWDESLGDFRFYGCDGMRYHAWELEQQAIQERAAADWVEGRTCNANAAH